MAECLIAQKRPADALARLRDALRINPEAPVASISGVDKNGNTFIWDEKSKVYMNSKGC